MGDRVAVLNEGEFAQIGTPTEIYERPATVFVATFLGSPRMNLLDATVHPSEEDVELTSGELTWRLPRKRLPADLPESVRIGFRPESVHVRVDDGTPAYPLAAAGRTGEPRQREHPPPARQHRTGHRRPPPAPHRTARRRTRDLPGAAHRSSPLRP